MMKTKVFLKSTYTLPDAGGGLEVCMVSVISVRYNGQQNYYLATLMQKTSQQ